MQNLNVRILDSSTANVVVLNFNIIGDIASTILLILLTYLSMVRRNIGFEKVSVVIIFCRVHILTIPFFLQNLIYLFACFIAKE